MSYNAIAVIPVRLAAERLPGKPLKMLGGKPLIQRVYEAVKSTALFQEIIILTDSFDIEKIVERFGGLSLLTSPECKSGTDRIIEIREKLQQEIIVNVQGDEPFIDRESLSSLLAVFNDDIVEIASLMHSVSNKEDLQNPNTVKIIVDLQSYALYFSRSLIPFNRNSDMRTRATYYKHIGVYAYRKRILDQLAELEPGILEQIEKLEQLRWLEHGYKIKMVTTEYDGFGIDTKEDLEKARLRYNK